MWERKHGVYIRKENVDLGRVQARVFAVTFRSYTFAAASLTFVNAATSADGGW